jgi:hypothetical protein
VPHEQAVVIATIAHAVTFALCGRLQNVEFNRNCRLEQMSSVPGTQHNAIRKILRTLKLSARYWQVFQLQLDGHATHHKISF